MDIKSTKMVKSLFSYFFFSKLQQVLYERHFFCFDQILLNLARTSTFAAHHEKSFVPEFFKVSVDHLFDNLESGKRNNKFFGKKSLEKAQGLHSHILMTGGGGGGGWCPTEVHILYPKKSQLQNLSTQKNPYLFSTPKKIPQCFCISKFYYLSSEITESATHLCMGS